MLKIRDLEALLNFKIKRLLYELATLKKGYFLHIKNELYFNVNNDAGMQNCLKNNMVKAAYLDDDC
ncbi:hypothetical protein T4D_5475 [Trichinella pseudospiralis]|uniref:Uncharacterized protein n=1 Tax=Trichinella pseudospiralis TaxID=6337 RepID=A0A0V1FXK6_TRIPS|nr:hypothetical protein T4D_5475 [Trichinella pseudospiralis]